MKKKNRDSVKKVLSNNFYMLRLLWKACPWKILYTIVTTVFTALLNLVNIYFLRYAVNIVQNGGDYFSAVFILIILLAIYIVYHVVISCLDIKLQPYFSYIVNYNLKTMTLKKMAECELFCYENPEYYNTYTRAMSECSGRAEAVFNSFISLISSFISLIGSGILAFIIDPLVLVFSIFPFIVNKLRKKKNQVDFRMNQNGTGANRKKQYAVRTFYSKEYAAEMRLSNIDKVIMKQYKDAVDEIIHIYHTDGVRIAFLQCMIIFFNAFLSHYCLLAYAAWQTLGTKRMLYGDCLVLVNTVQTISTSIDILTSGFAQLYAHSLYIDNLKKFMDYKPVIQEDECAINAESGDIVMKNVSFRYHGQHDEYILKDISLHIRKGEKIALVGHNGAGKTTLTKLLLRLYDPTEGSIELNGKNIKEYRLSTYRDLFVTVLQDYHHFSMSIKENVLLRKTCAGDEELVIDSLKKSGLYERVSQMPLGIHTILDREFDNDGEVLSGGQNQKLSISHVYAKGSPIVILDEPSSALDPIAEYEMYDNMIRACQNRTMIFISHRLSSTIMADRIYLLENGQIIESGNHNELMDKNGKYAKLFRVQSENYVKEGVANEKKK